MTDEILVIAIMVLQHYAVSVVRAENTKSGFSVVYDYTNVILLYKETSCDALGMRI